MKFTVYVDDNFHFSDECHRYKLGEFNTWGEAVRAAKKQVDEFLESEIKGNVDADELLASYMRFGEDPFISGGDPSQLFSAWDYAKQRCRELSRKQKMRKIEKAIEIAMVAHKGQVDKAGKPYILHPLRLMLQLDDTTDMIAAVLHDVLEDSDYTPERLMLEGIPGEAVKVVQHLSRKGGETYQEFIMRVAGDERATRIKMLDLVDNLNISRIENVTRKDLGRVAKYHAALKYLKEKSSDGQGCPPSSSGPGV